MSKIRVKGLYPTEYVGKKRLSPLTGNRAREGAPQVPALRQGGRLSTRNGSLSRDTVRRPSAPGRTTPPSWRGGRGGTQRGVGPRRSQRPAGHCDFARLHPSRRPLQPSGTPGRNFDIVSDDLASPAIELSPDFVKFAGTFPFQGRSASRGQTLGIFRPSSTPGVGTSGPLP
jgi:hypothetical protein